MTTAHKLGYEDGIKGRGKRRHYQIPMDIQGSDEEYEEGYWEGRTIFVKPYEEERRRIMDKNANPSFITFEATLLNGERSLVKNAFLVHMQMDNEEYVTCIAVAGTQIFERLGEFKIPYDEGWKEVYPPFKGNPEDKYGMWDLYIGG